MLIKHLEESFESHEQPSFDMEKEYRIRRSSLPEPIVADDGMGTTGINTNIDHLGARVKMLPMTFLKLAEYTSIDQKSERFLAMKRKIRTGTAIAPPFLELEYDEITDMYRAYSHEGRNRMTAIMAVDAWKELPIEVHLTIRGMRNADITDEVKSEITQVLGSEVGLGRVKHPIVEWINP